MLENECHLNMPSQLRSIMEKLFLNHYDLYVETAMKNSNLNETRLVVSAIKYS